MFSKCTLLPTNNSNFCKPEMKHVLGNRRGTTTTTTTTSERQNCVYEMFLRRKKGRKLWE